MKKSERSKLFDVARKMPPLHHALPGHEFDIRNSEVAKWLCSQPEIMQYVFSRVGSGGSGNNLIEYDSDTGTWQGVDYED